MDINTYLHKLNKQLLREVSQRDIDHIKGILGMDVDRAINEKPCDVFLLLLRAYIRKIQYLLMIYKIYTIFKEINPKYKPAFVLDNKKLLVINEIIKNEEKFNQIFNLYKELFLSDKGKESLKECISRVKNKHLKLELKDFFLGDNKNL